MRKLPYIVVILILVYSLGLYVPTGYYLVGPGELEDLGELIQVEGEKREELGDFFMVTITQNSANTWDALYGLAHPEYDLRPAARVLPPDMSREEYSQLMQSWMQDSKNLAQVIAMRRAGYEVDIVSDGVEVVDLIAGSPAEGILEPGDRIKEVEGRRMNLAEEVVEKIQQKEIDETVTLTVERDGETKQVQVKTVSHQEEPEKAALLVYVRTMNWRPLLPLDVEIETGPVVGPSAGLMFVLEILDRIVPENLTGGSRVAGTGTINLAEEVGSIGGVRQKVMTAERAGAEYFLVPAENYKEAEEASTTIEVVPVGTLEEVLDFLNGLQGTAYYGEGAILAIQAV